MITIRLAKDSELNKIVEIFINETSKKPYFQKLKKKGATEKVKKAHKDKKLYVSVFDGKVVGLMLFAIPKGAAEKRLYLDELWIDSDYQRKGIGRKFISFLEGYAKKKGIEVIDIIAHKKADAMKFYKKMKYKDNRDYVFLGKVIK